MASFEHKRDKSGGFHSNMSKNWKKAWWLLNNSIVWWKAPVDQICLFLTPHFFPCAHLLCQLRLLIKWTNIWGTDFGGNLDKTKNLLPLLGKSMQTTVQGILGILNVRTHKKTLLFKNSINSPIELSYLGSNLFGTHISKSILPLKEWRALTGGNLIWSWSIY